MLIGKNTDMAINNPLFVDKWNVVYPEVNENEDKIVEIFEGEVEMEKTEQQKYLGFVLSSKGDNMKYIRKIQSKSIWIINKIFEKLASLNLRKYYFECALLHLNVILPSSILYASEAYYNVKELELSAIERIEEHFFIKLFKNTRACPIL